MFQKVKLFSVSIVLALILSGCQEVDGTGDVRTKQPSVIVQNLDLSEVFAPSEVYIYSAEYWEADTEMVLDIFLDGVYDEKNNWAQGEQYIFRPDSKKEKVVVIYDGGRSWFGERRPLSGEAGFSYGIHSDDSDFDVLFPKHTYDKIDQEYSRSGKIYSQNLDEGEEAFVAAKEEVEDYLEKVHMEHYTVHAAAVLQGKKPENKAFVIYWRQAIDGILISDVYFDALGSLAGTTTYNAELDYDKDMLQPSSTLETVFLNGELVDFSATNVIRAKDKLKKYPVISVSEAYEKVEEQYRNYPSGISAPTLELAELQYKMVELDEKIYLYPIWTFCVKTEREDLIEGEIWNYYLIDAVSGEYFTGIDVGEIEGNSGLTR